jgi:hypothetical protein
MNSIQNVDTHALRASAVADGTLGLANGAEATRASRAQRKHRSRTASNTEKAFSYLPAITPRRLPDFR